MQISAYQEPTKINTEVNERPRGVARIWRWGHRGSGERKSPAGSRGRALGWWFGGGIAFPKLIAVIKDIWLPNHAQFCVFRPNSMAQPEIFL